MKKLMIVLAIVILLSSVASAEECFNAKGSTLVPSMICHHTNSTQYNSTRLDISNITGTEVTCRVRVYDQDGNDVSSHCTIVKGSSTSSFSTISTGSNTFSIPAHSSRIYAFSTNGKSVNGYAVIEWTSTDENLRNALIAGYCYMGVSDKIYSSMAFVNDGQPF